MSWFRSSVRAANITSTSLFDEQSFYPAFLRDMQGCRREVVIESPYITLERMSGLLPAFKQVVARRVATYVVTRDPREHDEKLASQAEQVIRQFEYIGIQVLLCGGNHHRKLAILDRRILWEGSLNILSQTKSREIMRRIDDPRLTMEMFHFLSMERYLYGG